MAAGAFGPLARREARLGMGARTAELYGEVVIGGLTLGSGGRSPGQESNQALPCGFEYHTFFGRAALGEHCGNCR